MVYRIDNRPKKHRGRYTILGIVLGVVLCGTGFYLYDNYKSLIVENVNQIKDITVSQINTYHNQNVLVNSSTTQVQNIQTNQQPTENINQPIINDQQTINTIDPITLENQIHQDINSFRQQSGLHSLTYNEQLANMARSHSQDMAQNNYFDHTSPNGQTLQNRLFDARIPCYTGGENIEQNFVTTQSLDNSIVAVWIGSPDHEANILSNAFTSEGIGVYVDGNNVFVTEDFC